MLYNLWDKVKVCINEPNYWLRKTLDENPNHEVAALFWTKGSVEEWWTDDEILTDEEWTEAVSSFDNQTPRSVVIDLRLPSMRRMNLLTYFIASDSLHATLFGK